MDATPEQPLKKAGIASLIGRANAGKSTLLNTLAGTKLAAVTHKPHTTRTNLHGVVNSPAGQVVFVDTPGVFKHSAMKLSDILIKSVHEALSDIDVILYIADPTRAIDAEERYIVSLLRQTGLPKILVLNKSDLPAGEKKYADDYRDLSGEFTAMFEVSALRNRHVKPLLDKVWELLPVGEPLYPPEQRTNINSREWVAEIIREKIFLALRQEVPYTTYVTVESMEEKNNVLVIASKVFTYEKRYKKMIIGEGGRSIKEIGIAARKELEAALNKKIFLELEVETDPHWMERLE